MDPKVAGAAPVFHPKLMKKGFIIALFFVLAGLVLVRFVSSVDNSAKTLTSPLSAKVNSKPSATPSPKPTSTPVATPTLSPTPTPVPSGYCLNVPVLFYHHIQPQADAIANKQTAQSVDSGVFDQQMAYLNQKGYTTISALDLVNALKNHTGVPANSIVVTLDDGYADQYGHAFQTAKKYNIRLNLLIASGLINNSGFMNWGQVNEIKNSGGYILDHTWSHYSLPAGSLEKIKYEVETAKSQIEQYTGQKVEVFGYPYGSFDSRSIQVLNEDGFLGAFSTLPGTYQCDSFIMALHRTRIGNSSLSYYGL